MRTGSKVAIAAADRGISAGPSAALNPAAPTKNGAEAPFRCTTCRSAFGLKQRASAGFFTAITGPAILLGFGVLFVQRNAVVVAELRAFLDLARRFDIDAAIFVHGFAVRLAGMVDPTRGIAALRRIDHRLVIDLEQERMRRLAVNVGVKPACKLVRN